MHRPQRRFAAWSITAAGGVVLLIGALLLTHPTPSADFGTAAAPWSSVTASSAELLSPTLTAEAAASTPPRSTVLPLTSGRIRLAAGGGTAATATVRTAPAAERSIPAIATSVLQPASPTGLSMPRLRLSAAVNPVLVENGELQVPANPSNVGWWTASVLAGSPTGTTVIDGHVDSAVLGLGIFYHLQDLRAGDVVTLTLSTGSQVNYRVDARRTYVKAAGLPSDIFSRAGPPRLALITCGGSFDSDKKSYDDNIVVMASPISTT